MRIFIFQYFRQTTPAPPLEKEGKAAAHLRKINCGERMETIKGNKRMEQYRKIIALDLLQITTEGIMRVFMRNSMTLAK